MRRSVARDADRLRLEFDYTGRRDRASEVDRPGCSAPGSRSASEASSGQPDGPDLGPPTPESARWRADRPGRASRGNRTAPTRQPQATTRRTTADSRNPSDSARGWVRGAGGAGPPGPSRSAARASPSSGSRPLCGVEFSRPNVACAVARARSRSSPGCRSRSCAAHRSTYARCSERTCSRASGGSEDQSRSCTTISARWRSAKSACQSTRRTSASSASSAASTSRRPTAQQLLADRDQHLGEHRVLGREVLVERRAGDAAGLAEVGHRVRRGSRGRRTAPRRWRGSARDATGCWLIPAR